jgi:hypothetical protein
MVDLDITRLAAIVHDLAPDKAALFSRIYSWYIRPGPLVLPDAMKDWVREKYGEIETQQIVRVTNDQTGESTLFNSIRARRPILTPRVEESKAVAALAEVGPFSNPIEETPADTFGRIEGDYCITASNIAKYDCLHAVVIFKEHNPFVVEEPAIADMISVAIRWCQEANRAHPEAVYPFILWNFLWRAGASIVHNHAQVLLTDRPYASPAWIEQVRNDYACRYGTEYYEDLYQVHLDLGLGLSFMQARVMAHLTPRKEHEVVIIAREPHDLAPAISKVLECYRNIGVQTFNAAVYMPPLGREGYYAARLVDRGDLHSRTSDIGGMELYAGTPVVASDPFRLMEHLAAVMMP